MTESEANNKITILESQIELLQKENHKLRKQVSDASWEAEYQRDLQEAFGNRNDGGYQGGA